MKVRTDSIVGKRWLPALSLAAFAAAAVSQADRQIFSADEVLAKAKETGKFTREIVDTPTRGSITSSDGVVLAGQGGGQSLAISFKNIPNSPALFLELSALTGIPASEFESLKNSGVSYRSWPIALTPQQARECEEMRSIYRAKGVNLVTEGERHYAHQEEFSAIVGAIYEGKGVAGLERSFEKELAGKPGSRVGLMDREGELLTLRSQSMESEMVPGQSIELTIDSELQKEATRAIRQAVESNGADSGVAVVLVPKTGDILAMAQWPTFDGSSQNANDASKTEIDKPGLGFNAPSMKVWEPGSTFKILTLAKALDEGVTTMGRYIQCNGSLQVIRSRAIRCDAHGGSRAHGSIDSTMAIAKSCNVCAALWARGFGHDKMVQYLDDLGLTRPTQLGLPLETAGQFNRKEPSKPLQLATMGFGQSMTVTPVGLAGAFGALANGGVRMEPRIVKAVGGNPLAPRSTGRVLTEASCNQVLDAMIQVIQSESGTGKTLRVPGYTLGGKTGTAEKVGAKFNPNGRKGYVSNFVGFVPAKSPQVVILVMVDNPRERYYGASVAGPVFVDLARASIELLGIPKEVPAPRGGPATKPTEPNISHPKPRITVTSKPSEDRP